MEFIVHSESDLSIIARQILSATKKKVFLFEGEMGAGKTTLIKAFCSALGSTDVISSPTFSIVNHYKTAINEDIFHFDFYRIKTIEEAIDIGFEEYLDNNNYCFIEWPGIILKLIFQDYVVLKIKAEDKSRLIKVDF